MPAEIIYSDETVIAILDARPIRPGHTLVMPRLHIPRFYELDDDVAQSLWRTVHRVARQVAERLRPEEVGLVAAGWDVPRPAFANVPERLRQGPPGRRTIRATGFAAPSAD